MTFPRRARALALALAACSVPAVPQNTDATGDSAQGSTASQTGGDQTTAGTFGSTGSQSETETGDPSDSSNSSPSETDTGNNSSTSTTTGTTDPTADPTTGTTGETDPTTGETDPTTGETDPTTGGPGAECELDEDCELFAGCCLCSAYPKGGEPPNDCPMPCDQTACEMSGVTAAECRLGTCVPGKVHCDDSMIMCDGPPPECPPGTFPVVADDNSCYTGACAPPEACDRVPSCEACAGIEGWMCVSDVAWIKSHHCEPIPPACDGMPTCACAGEACIDPYVACDEVDGGLVCSCPNC